MTSRLRLVPVAISLGASIALVTVGMAQARPGEGLGDISLLSTSTSGAKGNGGSELPAISAGGGKVVFWSTSTNLDPADTDALADVYVKDLATGALTLASTSDTGVKGNGPSMSRGAITADGTKVAFFSQATNLDPGDTDPVEDLYVKDLVTGDITLADVSPTGVKADARALGPALSADGTKLAFYTWADNLDPADTDRFADMYVKDLVTGSLTLVSTASDGTKGNSNSYSRGAISSDGTSVAFWSQATNLDPADTDDIADVYVKNLTTGELVLASKTRQGVKGNGESYGQKLSGDGTKLAFHSESTNLDPADTDELEDVYVKDLVSGALTLASTSDAGIKGNGESEEPQLSADGNRVAFFSEASNLDPTDPSDDDDVYVKDLVTGNIMLASTSDDGQKGNGASSYPKIASDGTWVAFESTATNLDPGDGDPISDIYAKQLDPVTVVDARGHGDSDYDGNGHGGRGDVQLRVTASTGDSEAEPLAPDSVAYSDLRADPPGLPPRAFRCKGIPSSMRLLGPTSVAIDGSMECSGVARAATFSLTVTDLGTNPPAQDQYAMMLFDAAGSLLYQWGDLTTVGLGDLSVTTS